MNNQFVNDFEILLKIDAKNTTGFQSTEYIAHGDCHISYTGNFLIVEKDEKSDDGSVHTFIPYNLDDVKTFRISYKKPGKYAVR